MTFEEIIDKYNLMTLENALVACFGSIDSGDGEANGYKVSCCGNVTYGSGLFGSDIAQCEKCGRRIVNVLSPHTSPFLIDWDSHTTSIPADEALAALWETPWMVIMPDKEDTDE